MRMLEKCTSLIIELHPKVRHKTLGVQFFMRHSFEEKLNIVSKVKSGQLINTSLVVRFLI